MALRDLLLAAFIGGFFVCAPPIAFWLISKDVVEPVEPPRCVRSHQEVVKAHDNVYAYDLHTAFVGPQVSITHVPEYTTDVCDEWHR